MSHSLSEFGEYLNFFLIFSSLLGLLYAIGELFSYHRSRKQVLLGVIFLGASYILFNFYLLSSHRIKSFPYLYLTDLPVVAGLGILLDEYFLIALEGKFRSFRRLYFKLIPIVLFFVLILIWNLLHETDFMKNAESTTYSLEDRPVLLITITTLTYVWCMLKILTRISKQIRWSTFRKNTTLKIGLGITIFCLALSLNALRTIAFGDHAAYQFSGIAIGFFFCFLYVLRQSSPDFFLEVRKIVEEEKKERISQISKLDHNLVRKQLEDLFEKEKIYREEKLNLRDLSEKLDLTSHQLSEFLNTEIKLSFYQYTNLFRVNEAKEKIEKEPDRSLLAIAYDVGFGSKSTFNEAFKKETGKTPREYREKILKKHPIR
ncbi:AraC family transcriptional regulator [Leptospira ilyithenensis]|uniref:AraC family transcriptional regulator n=1 Tax=Leptospira ilyithenensis TaxID=2484901 RepID=A0A4R9LLT0_9LEPT|nr:helix-turn-helix domain-containing protein [Leptospira ilyithenensis]TGN07124.1 AraC family transcriptional regulator [Leptospira ilyithenensis]